MKIWAKVTGLQFRGRHHYPGADELDDENAKTLQWLHSHRFYFNVKISQDHSNRDVEYLILEKDMHYILNELLGKMNLNTTFSCEDMALFIYNKLKNGFAKYKGRAVVVEVLEDNINGAEVGDL